MVTTVQIENGKLLGYITSREFAKLCHVQQGTIRMWVRRGKLEALKIGSEYYIKEGTPKPHHKKHRNKEETK